MSDNLDHAWATLIHYGADPEEYDDTAPELEEDPNACPVCGGNGETLGGLGDIEWLLCTDCGAVFYE